MSRDSMKGKALHFLQTNSGSYQVADIYSILGNDPTFGQINSLTSALCELTSEGKIRRVKKGFYTAKQNFDILKMMTPSLSSKLESSLGQKVDEEIHRLIESATTAGQQLEILSKENTLLKQNLEGLREAHLKEVNDLEKKVSDLELALSESREASYAEAWRTIRKDIMGFLGLTFEDHKKKKAQCVTVEKVVSALTTQGLRAQLNPDKTVLTVSDNNRNVARVKGFSGEDKNLVHPTAVAQQVEGRCLRPFDRNLFLSYLEMGNENGEEME